jgi:hypothetical protein
METSTDKGKKMQDITGLEFVAFYNAAVKFWVIIVQDEAGNQVNARYQFVNKRNAYKFVVKNNLVRVGCA